MYCRGEDTRREIVKNYELHPLAYVQLLTGQTKKSCTGDALTNAYYCFHYKSRKDANEGTMLCGEHAAKDFLQLISHPGLPLFNPLLAQSGKAGAGTSGTPQRARTKWDAPAKQLYDAIHLLVVCWGSPPGQALFEIKTKLERFSDRPPFASQVKAINTIIGKDARNRTLVKMVNDLAKNNSIKTYEFSLLDAILATENISSNFT